MRYQDHDPDWFAGAITAVHLPVEAFSLPLPYHQVELILNGASR